MKQMMQIYRDNREAVEGFLVTTISDNPHHDFDDIQVRNFFKRFPCLSDMYLMDEKGEQITPTWRRLGHDTTMKGTDRGYFINRIRFDDNGNYISSPYICANSGQAKVSIARKYPDGKIAVLDFNLVAVLTKMDLIDSDRLISKLSVAVYALLGGGLVLLALFLGVYGLVGFAKALMSFGDETLHYVFKSIIGITLAIAIYDLAKTILEQEVFYRSLILEEGNEYKTLTKFLTSIIIALSIESLMVVFKVAINDIREMNYPFYLISGVGILIISMAILNFVSRKKHEEHE
ncbi:MAG: PDC sensor domain-containing protein [Campylobacterales bacterium]|nr:PDC sensor domain-containing protein [Campylobacterales bacterium]